MSQIKNEHLRVSSLASTNATDRPHFREADNPSVDIAVLRLKRKQLLRECGSIIQTIRTNGDGGEDVSP